MDGSMGSGHETVFCWVSVSSLVLIIPWSLAHLLLFLFYPPEVFFFFCGEILCFQPLKVAIIHRKDVGKVTILTSRI
jgi:hypothetical protein